MVGRVLILEYLSGKFSIVANDAGAGMMLRQAESAGDFN